MTYVIRPYSKRDPFRIEKGDRTAAERLEPAREALRQAVCMLMDFENTTANAYDGLKDEELEAICHAAEMALRAARNARNLGFSGFEPEPLEAVSWPRH